MNKAMAVMALSALALAGMAYLKSEWREAAAKTPEAETVCVSKASQFKLGDIAKIGPCGALCLSVSTQIAASEERLIAANDPVGRKELREAGLTYYVKPGALVRVTGFDTEPEKTKLGSPFDFVYVRVLTGPDKDRGGWAAAYDLEK